MPIMKRLAVVALIPLGGVVARGCGSSVAATTTSTPTPTTAAPPTTAVAAGGPCTSGQLSVATGSSQGAGGTEILALIFTNTGSALCTLQGSPGVSAVIANGVQLGQPATRETVTSTPLVSLEPGHDPSHLHLRQPIHRLHKPDPGVGTAGVSPQSDRSAVRGHHRGRAVSR